MTDATATATRSTGDVLTALQTNVASVLFGKDDVVELALVALLAGGHLLVEDVPGVGKTLLAKALGASITADVQRVQFTPDLLPSDLVGVSVWQPDTAQFDFRPGPLFANIVLADEINRAGPKTQSALLEAMEERTITIDGTTHPLARPFMVIATQNPIELEGTYPLPEAQRDRFLIRTSLGYPDREAELTVLRAHAGADPVDNLEAVVSAATVATLIDRIRTISVVESIEHYVLDIVSATRTHRDVMLGASPRAGLALLRAARARAGLHGRSHVLPDDVKALAVPVLAHRLQLTSRARVDGTRAASVVNDVITATSAPVQ